MSVALPYPARPLRDRIRSVAGAYLAPSVFCRAPEQWVESSGKTQPTEQVGQHVEAVRRAGLVKKASPPTFRHSFATHLPESSHDIRTVPQLLGHERVDTTMIYTHVAGGPGAKALSTVP